MRFSSILLFPSAFVVFLGVRSAIACGASVGGVAGASSCSLAEHEEETRLKFRVGVSGSYASTAIKFTGGLRAAQQRILSLASFEYRLRPSVSLQLGVGPFIDGYLKLNGVQYNMAPGFVGAAGVSWRVVDPSGARPFVILGAQLSSVVTSTKYTGIGGSNRIGYEALDIRGTVSVGWLLADILAIYAVGRGFGGPIFWYVNNNSVLGTDAYHFQVGAGASITLIRRLDIFVEGIALGERGVSAGLGVAF